MFKQNLFLLLLFLFFRPLSGQVMFTAQEIIPSAAESQVINNSATDFHLFSIDLVALSSHFQNGGSSAVLELPGLPRVKMGLIPYEVRSPEFKAMFYDGGGVSILDDTPCYTYRGTVDYLQPEPTTQYLSPSTWWATFNVDGKGYEIVPVSHLLGRNDLVFAIYDMESATTTLGGCGLNTGNQAAPAGGLTACDINTGGLPGVCEGWTTSGSGDYTCKTQPLTNDPGFTYVIELGIVADYEFYALHGADPDIVLGRILSSINTANSTIFEEFLWTQMYPSTVVIYGESAQSDPYVSTDVIQAWDEVKADWQSNEDTQCARFDIVQLFSGKNLNAAGVVKNEGIGAVCPSFINPPFINNPTNAFSVSRHRNIAANNFMTVAHEVIHNLGYASHTDDLPTCSENCSTSSSDPLKFVMCSAEHPPGPVTPQMYGVEQCRTFNSISLAGCCLRTIDTPSCDNCNVTSTIEADNQMPFSFCGEEDIINFTATFCNDCTPRDLRVLFLSPAERQTITDFDASIFSLQSGGEGLTSIPISFASEECKTFQYSAQVNSSLSGPYTPNVSFVSLEEGEGQGGSVSIGITPNVSSTVGVDGTTTLLSDAIDDYGFFGEDGACLNHDFRTVSIAGILEIDVPDYCLDDFRFVMQPGASIVLQEDLQLEINNCVFLSCDDLWDAIEVEEGATLTVSNSRFEQAINAIRAGAQSTVHVTNSEFKDNFVGIFYDGESTSGDLLVSGCSFTLENGLNQTYLGYDTPFVGINFKKGLLAQVKGYTNEEGVLIPSFFKGLHGGIFTSGRQLDVSDADFFNMLYAPGNLDGNATGHGILARGTASSIVGLSVDNGSSPEPSATFNDCRVGIGASSAHLWVHGVHMYEVSTGIETVNCRNRQLRVFDSYIEAYRIGLSFMHNQPAIVIVEDNVIHVKHHSTNFLHQGIGILNVENAAGYSNYLWNRFWDNVIHLERGRDGIRITGGRYQYLRDNVINLGSSNFSRKGIYVEGSYKPLLSHNSINGPSASSSTNTYGIWADGLSSPILDCNTTTDVYVGVQFWNMNDNTALQGHNFKSGGFGLRLGIQNGNNTQAAIIDVQHHNGNKWLGTFSQYGAFNAATTAAEINASRFKIDPADVQSNSELLPTSRFPLSWFELISKTAAENLFLCSELSFGPPPAGDFYDQPTDLESDIIQGSFVITGYGNTSTEIARSRLLNRWTSPTTTGFGNAQFQQFINGTYNGSIGYLNTRRQALAAAVAVSDDDAGKLMNLINKIEVTAVTLRAFSSVTERNSQLAEMTGYQQALYDLTTYLSNDHTQALANLPANNPPGNSMPYVIAEQKVESLVIKEKNDLLTATDGPELLTIAESCPWYNGDAVYQARALYSKLDPEYSFDGDYCNGGTLPLEGQTESVDVALQAEIFPNPAKDYILLRTNQPLAEQSPCKVYDANGKVIAVDWVFGEDNNLLLEIASLQPGIYFVEIFAEDGKQISKKFIKQ